MNWNDLQYFIHLVNEGTLSAVAEKLSVQHTTVSRRINALEESLNVKLFDYVGKRYLLTNEGHKLYEQAFEIENNIHAFKRIALSQTKLSGIVTISAPPALANELLIKNVAQFQTQYPDIYLQIKGEAKHSNLYHRESDIALRLYRPHENELVMRTLASINFAFYAHAKYLSSSRPCFIGAQGNRQLYEWFKKISHQTSFPITFFSNDFYIIKNAIQQQIGIGLLPTFLASDELVAINPLTMKRINRTKESNNTETSISKNIPLYMVMHSDIRNSSKIRVTADWLTEIFNNNDKL
ncbi:MAG: LysR family transcriptional regulator [Gammaproteobacteria bacterium]|nr:LysR family transcriptional regulator [Gammaproteobacteria bacterium]